MRKIKYLIAVVSLCAIAILWNYYIGENFKSFFNISEWGAYMLIVPIVFFLYLFFTKLYSPKILIYISLGVFTSILLNTDLSNSFWFQKIIMTSVGAFLIWIIIIRPLNRTGS